MGDLRLHKLAGWDIAKKIGCHYSGDRNTIDHGGTFYALTEVENGYVPCVRFYGATVNGASFYEVGSVYFPRSWDDLNAVLRCCGWDTSHEDVTPDMVPHIVFDALLSYGFAEWDTTTWYVVEGEDDPGDGREVLRIGRDISENQILNRALREGGLINGR